MDALRGFFGRRLPTWEGHVRESLATLINAVRQHKGNAANISQAVVAFLDDVATGFSPSAYSTTFLGEVCAGCVSKNSGKPATLQALARIILDEPNHKGVAKMLKRASELTASDPAFRDVKVDDRREFWEAVQMGQFDDSHEGFAEISRRRSCIRPQPPGKAISTAIMY